MDHTTAKPLVFLFFWALLANGIAIRNGFYSLNKNEGRIAPRLLFRDIVGVFLFFLLTQLVLVPFGLVALNYYLTGVWEPPQSINEGWVNISAIIASFAGVMLFSKVIEPRTQGVFGTGSFEKWLQDVSLGGAAWLVCFPVVSLFSVLLTTVLDRLGMPPSEDQVAVRFLKDILQDRTLFWVSFWLISIVVPLVEEILFRGFLQSWLRQKISGFSAICLTSVIFSAFHFSFSQGWHNIDLLAALFLLSVYLGLLYEKRGSIWAPVALHAIFNGISEVAIFIQDGKVTA